MERVSMLVLVILSFTPLALGGKIYGSVAEGGKPVGQGVEVEITCGTNAYTSQTDAYGSFRLYVKDRGKCTLKVRYQKQSPSFEINSYDGSVQYDLILEKKDSQYTLRRR